MIVLITINMFISTKLFKTDRHFLAFSFLLNTLVCSHVDPNEKLVHISIYEMLILFIFRFQSLFSSCSTYFSLYLIIRIPYCTRHPREVIMVSYLNNLIFHTPLWICKMIDTHDFEENSSM